MNRRTLAFSLAAALALTGFSACSAPGKTPVVVNDPVSAAASTEDDPVSAALQNFDYTFFDETQQQTNFEDGLFGSVVYTQPESGAADAQTLVNRAAALLEWDTGKDFSETEFSIGYFQCEMANGSGSMAQVSAIIPDSDNRQAFLVLDAQTQLPVYYNAGYFSSEPREDFESWRQSWPEKAQGFCDVAGLGTIQSYEFSSMEEQGGRSFWVTLENGDIVQFLFTQEPPAGTVDFTYLSAIGGEEMVASAKDYEANHT